MHLSSFCTTSYKHWGKALNWNIFMGKKNQHFFSNYCFPLFCFPPLMYLASFFIHLVSYYFYLETLLVILEIQTKTFSNPEEVSSELMSWIWKNKSNFELFSGTIISLLTNSLRPMSDVCLKVFLKKKLCVFFFFFSSQVLSFLLKLLWTEL